MVFVAVGGLLVLVRPRLAWLHLPALAYGAMIELVGWVCPLTPLEWELVLAVVLSAGSRIASLRSYFAEHELDGRLLTRLLREGHVERETEEAVWAVVEGHGAPG